MTKLKKFLLAVTKSLPLNRRTSIDLGHPRTGLGSLFGVGWPHRENIKDEFRPCDYAQRFGKWRLVCGEYETVAVEGAELYDIVGIDLDEFGQFNRVIDLFSWHDMYGLGRNPNDQ